MECQRCGWCCENVTINVCHSDMLRWRSQERWDILIEISYLDNYGKMGDGFYIAKTTFSPKQPCPFLDGNECDIHDTKPRACKDAPMGYESFPNCPAFIRQDDDTIRRIKEGQYTDFKRAWRNKEGLFKMLLKARKVIARQS